MKYLMFLRSPESFRDQTPPAALMDAIGAFIARSKQAGTLVSTGGLSPSKAGLLMRSRRGKLVTTDGPFTETKEIIGGWAIVETPTRGAAITIATEFMDLHAKHWPEFECESEVRPIEFYDA